MLQVCYNFGVDKGGFRVYACINVRLEVNMEPIAYFLFVGAMLMLAKDALHL